MIASLSPLAAQLAARAEAGDERIDVREVAHDLRAVVVRFELARPADRHLDERRRDWSHDYRQQAAAVVAPVLAAAHPHSHPSDHGYR